MRICGAPGAELLEVSADGTTLVVAADGVALQTSPDQIARHARSTLELHPTLEAYLHAVADHEPGMQLPDDATQPVLAISIPGIPGKAGTRLLLVIGRETGTTFPSLEIRELEIFALVCATALARAHSDAALQHSDAALQSSYAIKSALVGAVHEAVIALDTLGIVRAVSASAAMLIGRSSKDAIGLRLRDLPGLAPLALAVAAGDRSPDIVKLATGNAKLRVRRFEGGLAVTLLPATAGTTRIGGAHFGIDNLVGESPLIRRARETAPRVADSSLPILITGETGTGKEILAQAIHNASARAGAPFVGVNVSAIPRELLESELFGYEGGAFTGASAQGNPGKFELAENGTLLLDEVGDLPLEMQPKLLRVLQERVVQRLGGSRARAFSAHVIASTNRDLEQDVRDGRFRLDLLHRLRVVHLRLPPLRERGNDMRLLVAHHLRLLALSTKRAAIAVAPNVMAALEMHPWPGNVRELINVLECEVSLLPPGKDVIDSVPDAIERRMRPRGEAAATDELMTLEGAEREACVRALQKTEGNVARAALILQVAKATLYSKIKRYGISQPPPERAVSVAPGSEESDR